MYSVASRTCILALITVASPLLCAPPSARAANAPIDGHSHEAQLSGDSPPTAIYFFAGTGGLVCDVVGRGPGQFHEGAFTIVGIPAGVSVDRAFFVTGIWDDAGTPQHSMQLTFAGNPYGTIPATTLDFDDGNEPQGGGLDLAGYVVDVTAQVTGNGVYVFSAESNQSVQNPQPFFGSLLAVVYSHPASPGVGIQLNAGGESLLNSTSTTTFAGVAAGPATLHLFTQADDPDSAPGESVLFNGATILGGPEVFSGNEGFAASYFALPVVAVNGGNTAVVNTRGDWFGWHFAALVYPMGPTPTIERTWGRIKQMYR